MKLLYCSKCGDVFNLVMDRWKFCRCGKVRGRYMDEINAVYSGGIPIGFNNFSFYPALKNQPESGLGREFEAFVIPKDCPTMEGSKSGPEPTVAGE